MVHGRWSELVEIYRDSWSVITEWEGWMKELQGHLFVSNEYINKIVCAQNIPLSPL